MAVDEEQKQKVFEIPAQYVNFIVLAGNPEEVVFQFGQVSADHNDKVFPVSKVIMSRGQAERMLDLMIKMFRPELRNSEESSS
jgi:hypothetical protein